ncbi:MAG: hypothetical protein HQL51_12815 [Magnetococcales bacterium]|nr:hypothetical protein [Magnetococcales bacterium]
MTGKTKAKTQAEPVVQAAAPTPAKKVKVAAPETKSVKAPASKEKKCKTCKPAKKSKKDKKGKKK